MRGFLAEGGRFELLAVTPAPVFKTGCSPLSATFHTSDLTLNSSDHWRKVVALIHILVRTYGLASRPYVA